MIGSLTQIETVYSVFFILIINSKKFYFLSYIIRPDKLLKLHDFLCTIAIWETIIVSSDI